MPVKTWAATGAEFTTIGKALIVAGLLSSAWAVLVDGPALVAQTDWEAFFSRVGIPTGLLLFLCVGIAWIGRRAVAFIEHFRDPLSNTLQSYAALMEALRLESAARMEADREVRRVLEEMRDADEHIAQALEGLRQEVRGIAARSKSA